jgi:hypothetical protein
LKNYRNIKIIIIILIIIIINIIQNTHVHSEVSTDYWDNDFQKNHVSIKSVRGKFYAYIVLLFNENQHFINLIQEDSISVEMMQKDGFHVKEYRNYIRTIKDRSVKNLAEVMYNIYIYPAKFNNRVLNKIQEKLAGLNIILRFSRVKSLGGERIVLDYCIFGKKEPVNISHPLFIDFNERIYNIQPFIYYDEFSTSNSTFYFDMIYINPDEVNNDCLIAQNIINGNNINHMFFVGARINDDIRYCIARAFGKSGDIKQEIFHMFIVHEITHKILNNRYNYFDQVTGEELALVSTIYLNPYLGLSVLYSYLDYSQINPHRIAAMNIIKFMANKTGKLELVDNPSVAKYFSTNEISYLIKDHFHNLIKNIKLTNN